jgi:hypothetical protein
MACVNPTDPQSVSSAGTLVTARQTRFVTNLSPVPMRHAVPMRPPPTGISIVTFKFVPVASDQCRVPPNRWMIPLPLRAFPVGDLGKRKS